MKRLLYILVAVAVLNACSGVSRERMAAQAAVEYYQRLAQGDAVGFLEGKAGSDSIPTDYAEQLLNSVELYREDMQQKHSGLRQVRMSDNPPLADTLNAEPYVKTFIILCYGDSTEEEVVVPMVEINGRWLMR